MLKENNSILSSPTNHVSYKKQISNRLNKNNKTKTPFNASKVKQHFFSKNGIYYLPKRLQSALLILLYNILI